MNEPQATSASRPEKPGTAIFGRLSSLADPARVRLLRLLEREALTVGELVRVVRLPQSTVSRHLKVLYEQGWVARRQEGAASWFRLEVPALPAEARELWTLVRDETRDLDPEDHGRMEAVVALREVDSARFFERVGGGWDVLRRQLYGDDFTGHALLALLSPDLVVADLGCGTGQALAALAPNVRRAIGVDREQGMLDTAALRLAGLPNVELRRGGLDALPLADGEVDAALCMLVLHHVEPLVPAFAEIARVLAPGGRCVLVDMERHDHTEYRQTMGHRHLGFTAAVIETDARAAGLRLLSHRPLPPAPEALGPPLFVAVIGAPG